MATAALVKNLPDLHSGAPDTALYRLDPPFNSVDHVIVTVGITADTRAYVFPATPSGDVVSWAELAAVPGCTDHAGALAVIGYTA